MKRIIEILLILLAAVGLLSTAVLASQSGFAGIVEPAGPVVSTPGTDVKKVEDKMADALAKLDSWKKAQEKEKITSAAGSTDQAELSSGPSPNSTEANLSTGNSTIDNSSIISPDGNSTLDGTPDDYSANSGRIHADDANSPAGLQNVGSNTESRFKGYYGMTASRHEIGKSGINSHMFLSGNFEMDKTVKFQDQGID